MASLSEEGRQKAIQILEQTRAQIEAASADDPDLRFQLRRYILKRLEFDERGTPTQRRKLKDLKRKFQRGLCYECAQPLPGEGCGVASPSRRRRVHRGEHPACSAGRVMRKPHWPTRSTWRQLRNIQNLCRYATFKRHLI